MKITKIETLALSRPHELERQWVTARYRTIKADCAIVVIHTDEGLTGIGEASAYGWPLLIREWVDFLAPELIGQDPTDPSIVPHPSSLNRSHDAAVAGIDCALWDLKGKIAGVPTARLLAEDPPMRIKLYASSGCMYDWRKDPHQLIEEALGYIEQGYKAMKFRVGTEWEWDGVTVDRYLGLVRELAEAVDGRMELMAEGNQRLTEEEAIRVAQEMSRIGGFGWLEEPIPAAQVDGYARIVAASDTPISGGESKTTLGEFRPYLEKRAYDIVQPDAGLCGITECLRIGKMAHRYDIDLVPHSWHNGLMAMANAHMVAALPNPRYLELCLIQGPLQWGIIADPPKIEDGYLILPDKPGLGVELAEDLEEKFPYIEGHYAIQVQR